jgi:hypothetical protein
MQIVLRNMAQKGNKMRSYIIDYDKSKHLFTVVCRTTINGAICQALRVKYYEFSSYDNAITYAKKLYRKYNGTKHIGITLTATVNIGKIVSRHYDIMTLWHRIK